MCTQNNNYLTEKRNKLGGIGESWYQKDQGKLGSIFGSIGLNVSYRAVFWSTGFVSLIISVNFIDLFFLFVLLFVIDVIFACTIHIITLLEKINKIFIIVDTFQ